MKYAFTYTDWGDKGRSLEVPTNTRFFIRNIFFNSASVLLNFHKDRASNVARCCLIHISTILRPFLYLLYVRVTCLCELFAFLSSFSLWLILWSHENRHTCSFYFINLECVLLLFGWYRGWRMCIIGKVQPQGVG